MTVTDDDMEGVALDGVLEEQQNGTTSREGGEEEGDDEEVEEEIVAAYASPAGLVLQRDSLTAAEIDAEIEALQQTWEMASILDFFHLFRKQLKLTRQFRAGELERVLVTSPGDTGLLADIHIDLMRGISPKNEISTTNWQIHLANKIKFHWRNLNDGTPCPFKPEKYLEAISYAELPAANRVRALHFLCCIRLDREDIGFRMFEAERPKTDEELVEIEAAAEASRLRASRSTRSSRTIVEDGGENELLDTLDTFRREPTGVDASGAAYYYFDHVETTGFRVYKELPFDSNGDGDNSDGENDTNAEDTMMTAEDLEREAAERAAAESKMGKKRRERALRKMPLVKSKYALRDHPKPKPWKLVATTLEELIALGESLAFGEASLEADKTLGQLFLEECVPQLQEKAEAEDRKRRAAERVRSRLGVNDGGRGGAGSAGGAPGDDGGLDGGGGGGYGASGRSRRARTQVNYAFNEYDTMLKSAIRRSQKGSRDDSPSGWEDGDGNGGGRRSRRGGSPVILTGEEAAMLGLRRGRSHTGAGGLHGVDSVPDLDERALRQQRASQRINNNNSTGGMYRSDTDASLLGTGGGGSERAGSYETQSSGGAAAGGRRGSGGGRSRLAPKYARDYVTDGATEDSDGPSYVARPSKRRGRPPSSATLAAREPQVPAAAAAAARGGAGSGRVGINSRSDVVEDILAQEQKKDAEIMKQIAAAEQEKQHAQQQLQQALQQQQQGQALLAQRQQLLQRIQQIQMLQAQGLPVPPEQLQLLSMLGQYQQQQQQGLYNAAGDVLSAGGVFPGSAMMINQFTGPNMLQQRQQPLQPFNDSGVGGVGGSGFPPPQTIPPPANQAPAGNPLQLPVYFNQNAQAAAAQGVPEQMQEGATEVYVAQWGGTGKRSQPTSKRVPPPP